MKYLLFFIFLFSMIGMLYANVYLGYTGYVQGSSKVVGMAGAFTGISDDINSIIYNPAGFVFSEFKNYVSLNYVVFTDMSLDLNKNSEDDIWKNTASNIGYLHRTKNRNRFIWGIYVYNFYEIVFTNDITKKDKFILQIGKSGEEYEIKFSLGALLIPLMWQLNPKLSIGINAKILTAEMKYYKRILSNQQNLFQERTTLHFDLSTMYKINEKFAIGLLIRPAMYFNFDETMNEQLENFNWFYDVYMPLQINFGLGYKIRDRFTVGFDLHYAEFKGNEILVGSNLIPEFSQYRLAVKSVLTPHIGAQYKTEFLRRDLFFRAGYYYQHNLFEGLSPKSHFTFSISWRAIKLPKYLLIKYISLGYSKDIADKYDVQTLTLDTDF